MEGSRRGIGRAFEMYRPVCLQLSPLYLTSSFTNILSQHPCGMTRGEEEAVSVWELLRRTLPSKPVRNSFHGSSFSFPSPIPIQPGKFYLFSLSLSLSPLLFIHSAERSESTLVHTSEKHFAPRSVILESTYWHIIDESCLDLVVPYDMGISYITAALTPTIEDGVVHVTLTSLTTFLQILNRIFLIRPYIFILTESGLEFPFPGPHFSFSQQE